MIREWALNNLWIWSLILFWTGAAWGYIIVKLLQENAKRNRG